MYCQEGRNGALWETNTLSASVLSCSGKLHSSFQVLSTPSQNQKLEKLGNMVIKMLKMAGLQGRPL